LLFDIVNDLGPLPRRLLGQVLNVAGLALLFTVLVSLFKPQKPLLKPDNEHERQRLQRLLAAGSNSTEDFFKYWPQPKTYWHDAGDRAMVAYRVIGNVAFALADPVAATEQDRARAVQEFMAYCRSHGWLTCFIMIGEDSHDCYKQAGYKLLRIGASAQVDVASFATQTSRNKWWRWVLNKARKQGWNYELARAPHSPSLMADLHRVSDAWLQRQHHVERGFALGYFDESYLQHCRLHLLRDENGELIAFTNELPVYNSLPVATIDLMRFLPDHGHAMPALLAHTIQQLHEEGGKQTFDLGFVPLASPAARTEQLVRQLGQFLLSEAVSAQGLEQFKNKFEPAWANNYMAFDGDWIDLVHVSRQLDSLLEP
jgi:phosphatidylglycerol lysyltransferase